MEAIVYFPSLESFSCKQQLLRGPVVGSGFERREDVILGLVLLARGEIGPGQIELRGRLVERVHGDHGIVFANGPGKIILREPQSPRWRCSSSSIGIDIVDAVERGGRVRGLAELFFERGQLFQAPEDCARRFFRRPSESRRRPACRLSPGRLRP